MSLKSLAAAGRIKKTDLFRVKYEDLQIEAGFNLRDLKDAKEHIHSIYQTIIAGGDVPPLYIRLDDQDNTLVVDGHCRHAAYGMAIKAGYPIEWIDVLPFRGNDAERVAKMITSSQSLPLSTLAVALGYKRLIKFGWENDQVATYVGKSVEHVKQLLILANANADVHKFVRAGSISAYAAIDLLRKHGEKTGEFIEKQAESASAKGKVKVTKGGIEGRALPKKIVTNLMSSVEVFASRLPMETRVILATLEKATDEEVVGKTVTIDAVALLELLRAQAEVDAAKAKQADKQHAKDEAAKQTQIEA
jgi:ParB family chromosome partitioning protein